MNAVVASEKFFVALNFFLCKRLFLKHRLTLQMALFKRDK